MYHELISVERIHSGLFSRPVSDLFTWWRDNKGRLNEKFTPLLDKATMCSPAASENAAPPPLVYAGDDSLVAWCFSVEFARRVAGHETTPDPTLETIAAKGYWATTQGEPALSIISTTVETAEFGTVDLVYERLLVPVETITGKNLVACMAVPIRCPELFAGPGNQYRRHYSIGSDLTDRCRPELPASVSRQPVGENSRPGRQSLFPPVPGT